MTIQRISWWPTTLHPSSVSPTLWTGCVKSRHRRSIFKDSVQMECEELFPSSLSLSHPPSLHPPPPPLRVLPNEALRFSMWASYSESQQPWAPIWMLVTLSGPLCAADLTLSLSQMLADSSDIQTHINTYSQMHQRTHFKCPAYSSLRRSIFGSLALHYHVWTHLCAFYD